MGLLTNISLFSGAGGLDLGAKMVGGFRTVAYCEWDKYAQGILMSRIMDGGLDDAPLWDDVTSFDARPFLGLVDVVSGGFPCQPHSGASIGRKGGADERNLWPEYMRIVRECRPSFILGENVGGIITNGFAFEVLADLEEAGYCAIPAFSLSCATGGVSPRRRVFFIAHAKGLRLDANEVLKTDCGKNNVERRDGRYSDSVRLDLGRFGNYSMASHLRVGDGVAEELDEIGCRIKACGNGVDPYQGAQAWQKIKDLAGVSGN